MGSGVKADILKKLCGPEFIGKLLKLNSLEEVKSFLISQEEKLSEEEVSELSLEVYDIISGLKKMSEKQLEEVAGGFSFKDAVSFGIGGFLGAFGAKRENSTQQRIYDATKQLVLEQNESINRINNTAKDILNDKKQAFDKTTDLALAAMASLSALALLKIIKSAGKTKNKFKKKLT